MYKYDYYGNPEGWVCTVCGSINVFGESTCTNCGASENEEVTEGKYFGE